MCVYDIVQIEVGASRFGWVQPIAMGLVLSLDVKKPGCSFDQS